MVSLSEEIWAIWLLHFELKSQEGTKLYCLSRVVSGSDLLTVSSKGGGSQQLDYHDCSGRIPGHTTIEPQVGFELATNSIQFYTMANLDKTSLYIMTSQNVGGQFRFHLFPGYLLQNTFILYRTADTFCK